MILALWPAVALAYQLASRLVYVLWVGVALRAEEREQRFTRDRGPEAGFAAFRRRAAFVMNNDGASFVVLCVVARDTLHLQLPPSILLGAGAVLLVAGLGVKLWAVRTLGWDAFYWRNFFVPPPPEDARPNS